MFNGDGAPLLHTPRKLATSLSRPAIERAAGEAIEELEQVGDGRTAARYPRLGPRTRTAGRSKIRSSEIIRRTGHGQAELADA
jgi:hypothetical protein